MALFSPSFGRTAECRGQPGSLARNLPHIELSSVKKRFDWEKPYLGSLVSAKARAGAGRKEVFAMALIPIRKREPGRERGPLARLHNEVDDLFRGFFED